MTPRPLPEDLFFDHVSGEEVVVAHTLEVQGFSAEEAASIENLRYRQVNAPELFLGAFVPQPGAGRTLLGYIDGVLSSEPTLTYESMSTHTPGARTVLIHGLCVRAEDRGRGIASALLTEYERRLAAAGAYDRALLIAHEEKVPLYEGAGFKSRGPSSISFTGVRWIELEWAVPAAAGSSGSVQEAPQTIPPGLLEALQTQRSRPSKESRVLSSFVKGIIDVSKKEGENTVNRYDVLCINEHCGSVILKQGVASLQERESVQMEPAGSRHPDLPGLPGPLEKVHWWLVTPSPMAFENIGFSKPVNAEKPLKLLACAECDLGPIGWCEPGGNEFWVASQRVRYKA
ncbi:acyl-CoA N-acyltransferase [Gloeopeniophorella convolvens]|nr:acyl-CoA N-acyltransferase [Gloeopeniophorella convolvens]